MIRTFVDIETSPNVVYSWRLGPKIHLDHHSIVRERAIICICWKHEGSPQVHSLTWDREQDDREMLRRFAPVLSESDEIVAHNGDRFDFPWIYTRCLKHGINLPSRLKSVDTLQWARRKFYFNSNRLDYLSKFLGRTGKIKTDFSLWKRIIEQNDPKALDHMVRYNKTDVKELAYVYRRMAPYMPARTHCGVLAGGDKWSCPHCGKTNIRSDRRTVTEKGTVQWRMLCQLDHRVYYISDKAHSEWIQWRRDQRVERKAGK